MDDRSFSGGYQAAERLAMAELPLAPPPGRRGRRLALQADRVGGGRLGGVGGVELEPGLEITDRGLQGGDPFLEGFPGVQEGGPGVGGNGAPEWLRDRKLLAYSVIRKQCTICSGCERLPQA
jgi:hypothetical protein